MAQTYEIDPVTRIEGHMSCEVETTGTFGSNSGLVTGAQIRGEMYRGFENILKGRAPTDAIEIVQRI